MPKKNLISTMAHKQLKVNNPNRTGMCAIFSILINEINPAKNETPSARKVNINNEFHTTCTDEIKAVTKMTIKIHSRLITNRFNNNALLLF